MPVPFASQREVPRARRDAIGYNTLGDINPNAQRTLAVNINGDSISARNWRESLLVSITKTSPGIALAVSAATTSLLPGMDVKIHGTTSDYFNGWHKVLTVVGLTFTFAIDPNAPVLAVAGTHPMQWFSWHQKTHGWWVLTEAKSGHNYNLIDVGAGGSTTSLMRLNTLQKDVLDCGPSLVIEQGSLNDVASAHMTPAVSLGYHEDMLKETLKTGADVVFITSTPFSGATFNTAANLADEAALRNLQRQMCTQYGVPEVDAYGLSVDPASTTAAAQTGWLDTDGLHWAGPMAEAVSTAMIAILDTYAGWYLTPLVTDVYDKFGNTGSSNILANSEMTGVNGTATSVTSGTEVATGWIVTNSSMTTCEVSKGTAGAMSMSQIITVGGTAGSCTCVSESLTARITAGQWLRMTCRVKLTLNNTFRLAAYISLTPTGGQSGLIFALSTHITTSLPSAVTDEVLTLYTEPFLVPAGATYTVAHFGLQYVATAGGAAGTIELYQPSIRQTST